MSGMAAQTQVFAGPDSPFDWSAISESRARPAPCRASEASDGAVVVNDRFKGGD